MGLLSPIGHLSLRDCLRKKFKKHYQNPRVLRVPLEITLLRGRTEPDEEGRAEADEALLEEDCGLLEVGLLPEEGLEPEGLDPVEGLEPVDGVLVFGAAGFSEAGGIFVCATGAPPPLERL